MIPVSLLLLWVILGTSEVVGEVISTAERLGILNLSDAPAWVVPGSSGEELWSGTLGEFGLLNGKSLQWAELAEAFTRNNMPQVILQVSIALLYLSWIAIWWALQTRRETDQLPEG
jgi:hypothetical protein